MEDEGDIKERLLINNVIIKTINVGDERFFSKVITVEDIEAFAKLTGDFNPIHIDSSFAQKTIFGGRIAHGILSVGLISTALSKFPGIIVYLAQDIRFLKPVRPGDKVLISAGKDRGKKGKVLRVFPARERVLIEGMNMIKKNTRPTQKNPQGGIIERESSIHASNVQLICPGCGAATRVGKRETSKGRVRVCKKCKQDIDK